MPNTFVLITLRKGVVTPVADLLEAAGYKIKQMALNT